jgi:hypothetical protein
VRFLKSSWDVAAGRQVNSHWRFQRRSSSTFTPTLNMQESRSSEAVATLYRSTGRGVASQKIGIFISTTVRTSHLAPCALIFTIGTHMQSCRKYRPKWPNNNNHEVDTCDYWMIISTGTEKRTYVVIIIINITANVGVNMNGQKQFLLKNKGHWHLSLFTIKQTPVRASCKPIFCTSLFESNALPN